MTPITAGGLIAAGEGSRLRRDGWTMPKPLVPIQGVALLERVLSNFVAAGLRSAAIIFNEQEEDCARFVRERFGGRLDLKIVVATTASSWESLRTIEPLLPEGPALVSTVDAWCSACDFAGFLRGAEPFAERETVLAVTPYVDDERPLWVRLDDDGRVLQISGDGGDAVTAGIYVFSPGARRFAPRRAPARLREFLQSLVEAGQPVRALSIPKVIDVDRAADVLAAEAMACSEPKRVG